MRTLRVVITVVGGVPLITATLVPSGCGGESSCSSDTTVVDASVVDVTIDPGVDRAMDVGLDMNDATPDMGVPIPQCRPLSTHIVSLPPPGVAPDPGQLCTVTSPAGSSSSARVTFANYNPSTETADGFIAVQPTVASSIIGLPTIAVTSASQAAFAMLEVTGMQMVQGGYVFNAKWPTLPHSPFGGSMNVKATFTIGCLDGGTQIVEAITPVNFCFDGDRFEWVSAGDACTVCTVIAEMAPSPIVSDVKSDSLPLARVIRIVVREVARIGRTVLIMAQNDGGADAEYEWRVSKGRLETIAPDIVLWTLPDGVDCPFGQVAVWNETGAVVENFVWGGA